MNINVCIKFDYKLLRIQIKLFLFHKLETLVLGGSQEEKARVVGRSSNLTKDGN